MINADRRNEIEPRLTAHQKLDGDTQTEREFLIHSATDNEARIALLEFVARVGMIEEIGKIRNQLELVIMRISKCGNRRCAVLRPIDCRPNSRCFPSEIGIYEPQSVDQSRGDCTQRNLLG